jgi:hypothetical protein
MSQGLEYEAFWMIEYFPEFTIICQCLRLCKKLEPSGSIIEYVRRRYPSSYVFDKSDSQSRRNCLLFRNTWARFRLWVLFVLLMFCIVFWVPLVCFYFDFLKASFGHCIVWTSIYGFWLPLQTSTFSWSNVVNYRALHFLDNKNEVVVPNSMINASHN